MGFKQVLGQISTEPVMVLGAAIFATHQITLPQLLVRNGCLAKYNRTVCQHLTLHKKKHNEMEEESGRWNAAIYGLTFFTALLSITFMGTLSDRIKKSRLMLLIPTLAGLQSTLYLVISWSYQPFPPWILLFGSIWTGLYGSIQGIILMCSAFVASVSSVEHRTVRFVIIECMICVGIALAGISSGFLIETSGFPSIFIMTLLLSVINFIYIRIFLWYREDISVKEKQKEEDVQSGIELTSQVKERESTRAVALLCSSYVEVFKSKVRIRFIMLLCALALTLSSLVPEATVETLYLKRHPFHLSSSKLGMVFFIQNITRAIGACILNYILNFRLQVPDVYSVCLAFAAQVAFFLAMGLVKDAEAIIPLQFLSTGFPLLAPGLRSMITKLADSRRCGSILGVTELFDVLAAFVSMVTINIIYAESVFSNASIVFYVNSGNAFLGICILFTYRMVYGGKTDQDLYSSLS